MTRRTLITGGAGFIGSHLSDLFLANGWSVDVIDNLSSGKRENVNAAAKFHELDIRSPDSANIVTNGEYDVILHLAAQIDVRRSVADPVFDASVNVGGTLKILEALRRGARAQRTRVVFTSTGGALYGEGSLPPSPETAPKNPDAPYGIAKLSAEHYLAYYARVHGIDTACARFGNVYGPRQDPHGEAGVVAIFCGRILDNQPLLVFGDGRQTRDYVHVTDAAEATYALATATLPAAGDLDKRAFNVGTGIGTSVLDLAATLLNTAGVPCPIEFAPKRVGELQDAFLSIEKARSVLGWSPRISLQEGLADTFAWFSARYVALTPPTV